MDQPKPVSSMSNRELLEEISEHLRYVRAQLKEFEPFLAAFRAASNGGGTYTAAAGLRKTLRRARDAT